MAPKHPTSPCGSCPYRKDAKLGYWHREHYQSVLDSESAPNGFGAVFQCHGHGKLPKEERGLCAGFVNDQAQRGVPNINLRLLALTRPDVALALKNVSDGGHEVFSTATEMAKKNLRIIDAMSASLVRRKRGRTR